MKFFLSLFLCRGTWIKQHVGAHMARCVCRVQKTSLDPVFCSILVETRSLVYCCICQASWSMRFQGYLLCISPILSWKHKVPFYLVRLYVNSGDPNTSLHTSAPNSWMTESSARSKWNSSVTPEAQISSVTVLFTPVTVTTLILRMGLPCII